MPFITGLRSISYYSIWEFVLLFSFVCQACHAFRGGSVNSLPGLDWKTHCHAASYRLQQHSWCLPSSLQVSQAPSSCLLHKMEASDVKGEMSCRQPINKWHIPPLALPCHCNRDGTSKAYAHKITKGHNIFQNFSTSDFMFSKVKTTILFIHASFIFHIRPLHYRLALKQLKRIKLNHCSFTDIVFLLLL